MSVTQLFNSCKLFNVEKHNEQRSSAVEALSAEHNILITFLIPFFFPVLLSLRSTKVSPSVGCCGWKDHIFDVCYQRITHIKSRCICLIVIINLIQVCLRAACALLLAECITILVRRIHRAISFLCQWADFHIQYIGAVYRCTLIFTAMLYAAQITPRDDFYVTWPALKNLRFYWVTSSHRHLERSGYSADIHWWVYLKNASLTTVGWHYYCRGDSTTLVACFLRSANRNILFSSNLLQPGTRQPQVRWTATKWRGGLEGGDFSIRGMTALYVKCSLLQLVSVQVCERGRNLKWLKRKKWKETGC